MNAIETLYSFYRDDHSPAEALRLICRDMMLLRPNEDNRKLLQKVFQAYQWAFINPSTESNRPSTPSDDGNETLEPRTPGNQGTYRNRHGFEFQGAPSPERPEALQRSGRRPQSAAMYPSTNKIADAMRWCVREKLSNIKYSENEEYGVFLWGVYQIMCAALRPIDKRFETQDDIFDEKEFGALHLLEKFHQFVSQTVEPTQVDDLINTIAITILVQCMMGRKHSPPKYNHNIPLGYMGNISAPTTKHRAKITGNHIPSDLIMATEIWNVMTTTSDIREQLNYVNQTVDAAVPIFVAVRLLWDDYKSKQIVQDGNQSLHYLRPKSNGLYEKTELIPSTTWGQWYAEVSSISTQDDGGVTKARLLLLMLGALYVLVEKEDQRALLLQAYAVAPRLMYAGNMKGYSQPYYELPLPYQE